MGEFVGFQGDLLGETTGLHGERRQIGSGNEHLVFNSPLYDQLTQEGNSDISVVEKISTFALRQCNGGTEDENKAQAIRIAESRNRRHKQLRAIFGANIVPEEETVACTIWLDQNSITRIWPEQPPTTAKLFYTTLTRQQKVSELNSPYGIFQFKLPYAEFQPQARQVSAEDYTAANDRWITRAADLARPLMKEREQYLEVQQSPHLNTLVSLTSYRPAITAGLKRIVPAAITYGKLYGEFLDFAGARNAIVTSDGGAKLVDVLVPHEYDWLRKMPTMLAKVRDSKGLRQQEVMILLNTLGYVRSMNFLAAWLGLPDRLCYDDTPSLRQSDWERVQKILVHSSPGRYAMAKTVQYPLAVDKSSVKIL